MFKNFYFHFRVLYLLVHVESDLLLHYFSAVPDMPAT